MKQDEIIEMARQAGFSLGHNVTEEYANKLEAFAKLVDAKATAKAVEREREACLDIVEPSENHRSNPNDYIGGQEVVELLDELSCIIRARGNKT